MKKPPMIIHPDEPDAAILNQPTALDEVRSALAGLLDARQGTLRIADALVTIAAELAVREAGSQGASAWLRRIAEDVRSGRLDG